MLKYFDGGRSREEVQLRVDKETFGFFFFVFVNWKY